VTSLRKEELVASTGPSIDSITETEGDTNVGNLGGDSASSVENSSTSNAGERLLLEW
jgi:hypothetical protein